MEANKTVIDDGIDPKAIRKCPLHQKYEGICINYF